MKLRQTLGQLDEQRKQSKKELNDAEQDLKTATQYERKIAKKLLKDINYSSTTETTRRRPPPLERKRRK